MEPDPVGHRFQSADDSQRMNQVTFKAIGSEEAQLLKSLKVLKESIFNQHLQNYGLCLLQPKVNVTTLKMEGGEHRSSWSSVPGIVTSPSHA